ncbi:MAG: hypothetical protein CMM02_08395 [Rhodopirellula sp.]|nr:hypothetical protein [Rhodopirellula sp.]
MFVEKIKKKYLKQKKMGKPQISSHGRYKDSSGVVKTVRPVASGYASVKIQKKLYLVHRLMAIAFKLPREEGQDQVNHINGNPSDNFLWNLEWANRSENVRHSYATNTSRKSNAFKRSKPILGRKVDSTDEWVKYASASEAARVLKLKSGNISAVVAGKVKKTGGYEFVKADANEPECLDGEEWKPFLTGYVSSMGRYKSCRGVVLTPSPAASGYSRIGVDGKVYLTHRAIGVAFGILNGMDDPLQIDHIDGNPSNNCLNNLRAVTRSQNIQHSFDTNTERGSHALKRSKPVRGRKRNTEVWTTYASANDAARRLDLYHQSITAVLKKRYTHTGNYEFEYAEPNEPECLEGEEWRDIEVSEL